MLFDLYGLFRDTPCNYCTKDDLHVHLETIISVRYNPFFLQSAHFCQQFNQDLRILVFTSGRNILTVFLFWNIASVMPN